MIFYLNACRDIYLKLIFSPFFNPDCNSCYFPIPYCLAPPCLLLSYLLLLFPFSMVLLPSISLPLSPILFPPLSFFPPSPYSPPLLFSPCPLSSSLPFFLPSPSHPPVVIRPSHSTPFIPSFFPSPLISMVKASKPGSTQSFLFSLTPPLTLIYPLTPPHSSIHRWEREHTKTSILTLFKTF